MLLSLDKRQRNAVFFDSEIQLMSGKSSDNSAATSQGQKYAAAASAIGRKPVWLLTNWGRWAEIVKSGISWFRELVRSNAWDRLLGNDIGISVIVLQHVQIPNGMWCSETDGKLWVSTLPAEALYWRHFANQYFAAKFWVNQIFVAKMWGMQIFAAKIWGTQNFAVKNGGTKVSPRPLWP